LLERSNVNPGAEDNQAIQLASAYGYADIVRLLLKRTEVNPGANNNIAIRLSSTHGNSDIVRI
jgi:ankyrin repeat protein